MPYVPIHDIAEVVVQAADNEVSAKMGVFRHANSTESCRLGADCILINDLNMGWLNEFADNMNATIRETVESVNQTGTLEIFFVDTQAKFTGRNLCTGDGTSGINSLQYAVTPGEDRLFPWFGYLVNGQAVSRTSVHPNGLGTDLYSQALEDALANL